MNLSLLYVLLIWTMISFSQAKMDEPFQLSHNSTLNPESTPSSVFLDYWLRYFAQFYLRHIWKVFVAILFIHVVNGFLLFIAQRNLVKTLIAITIQEGDRTCTKIIKYLKALLKRNTLNQVNKL